MAEGNNKSLILAATIFLIAVLTYLAYQYAEEKDKETLSITVGEGTISVE